MRIKIYDSEQIYSRRKLLKRLYELTNNWKDDGATDSGLRNDLNSRRRGKYFLAWRLGKVIGWCLVSKRYSGNLQIAIYVEAKHRNKKVGSKLAKKAKAYADSLGKKIIHDAHHNILAISMFKKIGIKWAPYEWAYEWA